MTEELSDCYPLSKCFSILLKEVRGWEKEEREKMVNRRSTWERWEKGGARKGAEGKRKGRPSGERGTRRQDGLEGKSRQEGQEEREEGARGLKTAASVYAALEVGAPPLTVIFLPFQLNRTCKRETTLNLS